MLTLTTGSPSRDCQRIARRDFLRVGAVGLTGLALPSLIQMRSRAAEAGEDYIRDKAVVVVFLGGGASHIETFNPNMDSPAPFRSVTGQVKTRIPGMSLGGTFPLLAEHADKLALVHSFQHAVGNHEKAIVHMLTGGTDTTGDGREGHSMGSMYARIRGANHPRTGLPTYALLTAPEIDDQYRRELSRITKGCQPGSLGPSYAAFNPSGSGEATDNFRLHVPADRLSQRRALLTELDRIRYQVDQTGAMEAYDRFTQQAIDLVLGSAARAFDLNEEDPRTLERYDTSGFRVGKKLFRPATVGQQMLLARRLVEAGCGFITVQNAGWDMHSDGNNPGIHAGMEMLGRPLDKALSAWFEDLDARGLTDKVLTIITGDFGRTPKINTRGGRDHWANLCTLAFAGGGLRTGQIIGQSARNNDVPATDPYSTDHLLATVMHALFDVGQMRISRTAPADLMRKIESSRPIEPLFG